MADEENERKTALMKSITAAFLDVERGSGVSLHEADVIDDYGSNEERAAARLLDPEERWQDVPEIEIARHHSRISFLDAEGFCYYAPAYMLWALKYHKTPGSASDFVFHAFNPRPNTDLHKYKMDRFALFTMKQSQAICGFFQFIKEYGEDSFDKDDATEALTGYWGQFCNV